ncbi:hypothetical protein [Marinifilum caeruleilacunae]|uniref:Uncharacterized protein n=1 Tax=Marinifilum caeruleilacunae TaxID=2499076 RepID=A0ABX1WZU0_9BACT|nr:hypothetical protein [Marinifilum caeruleilacunae]NOU61649.1 hypothetical protein [Marinifilum caeruleilacunae]
MKRLSLLLMMFSAFLLVAQSSQAQEKDEKKEKHEVHVKVKVIEDGKETVIDTIFHEHKDHDEIMKIIELKGVPDSLMRKHMVWFSGDDKKHGTHSKKIESFVFSTDSTFDGDVKKMMKKFKFSDKEGNVFFHSGDSCISKDIHIEMLHGGKHKMRVMPFHGGKGKKVIIINDDDDVEISEEDGVKIIKIKSSGDDNVWIEKISGDHNVEVEVEVEVEEKDGKKVKKIKRKKTKKEKE